MTKDQKLKQSRERFKLSSEAFARQRKREKADLEFQEPDRQWTTEAKAARDGQEAGGGLPAIPPRPRLSISQIDQPCQLVQNQIKAAHLGINIHPLSEDASKENAERIQGVIRRIEQDSHADQAIGWAADRASKAGWGVFRINTRFVDNRDKPIKRRPDGKLMVSPEDFDQVLTVDRILRQEYVHFDPAAEKPDFSDGEFAHVESWMAFDDFKRQYPKAKTSDYTDAQLGSEYKAEAPDWTEISLDGKRAVRIVEYFYKQHDVETIVLLKDGTAALKSDLPPGIPQEILAERDFDTVNVLTCTHTAFEILDEGDWESPYIPLIVVVGKELIPFDGERRWVGIIGPAKDGQRFYNVSASTVVENMLLEPKTPFVGDPRQFEGFEAWWQQANSRAFPYLPAHMVIENQVLPAPQRVPKDTTGMSLAMLGLQEAKTFVQSVTGIFDPALGQIESRGRDKLSGKAVLAYQGQSDATNNHYLQNLRDITYPYYAQVLLSKLKIYDRPGRIVRLLGEEDKPSNIMVKRKFYTDDEGRPVPYDDGAPRDDAEYIDLAEGVYSVTVTAGKSYQSRLQQGREELSILLPGMPPELQLLLLPTYLKFLDTPGASDMAKIVKRFRDQKFPGIEKEEGDKQTPEQMQAENEALKAKLQELEQVAKGMAEELKTDQAKQQAQILKAAEDNKTKEGIAQLNAQTKLEEQNREANLAITLQEMKDAIELLKLQLQGQQQSEQREHEKGLAKAQAGMGQIEGEAGRQAESEEAQRGREFEGSEAERDRQISTEEAEREREFGAEQSEADRKAAEKQAKAKEPKN